MGIPPIYYRLPCFLQNAAFSLYGYHARARRYGPAFEAACRTLRENETLPAEEHERRQLRSLRKMLRHCDRNVPHYRRLFPEIGLDPEKVTSLEDLRRLPLLEKRMVLRDPEDFAARNYGKADLIMEETSGTSGSPLKVRWHKDFYPWIYALYEVRMRGSAGVGLKDRRANLTGKALVPATQEKPPFWRRNLAERQLYMSGYHLSSRNMPGYAEALRRFRPAYVIGYPGNIVPVARHLKERGERVPSVRSVISCSEHLSPEARRLIEAGFECKVYNHYGSVEWVATMNECCEGNMHVSPEFGIIEVVGPDGAPVPRGEEGELVCTGLLNDAMPLIRYRTGDMGSLPKDERSCPCGRTLPVFGTLGGRKMSFVSMPGGGTVGSAALSTAFHAENILESQIVQEARDSIGVRLVVTERFSDRDMEHLLSELRKRTAPLRIGCERVDSIPREKGGKAPWIINRVGAP